MPRELLMMQNSFEWGTAEGQTLEIENAIRSNVRGLKIEGQTYQNLLSDTKNLAKFVYNNSTGEYTLTNPASGAWNAMSINYTRPIQAGEKLLIRINIVKNTIQATGSPPVKITFSNGNSNLTGYKGVDSGFTGLLEHYCDGATVSDTDSPRIHISTNNYTSGELVVKDIQVIPVSTNPLSYTDKTKEYVSTKSEFNYIYTLDNLKANTTYTLSYEIKSSNKITTNDNTILFRIEKITADSNTIIKAGFTGTVDNIYRKHKLTFNTGNNTVQTKINLRNQFNNQYIGLTENTLSVRNLVLLEGDYTNEAMITELPTSINGIESVAEREFEQNLYTEGDLNVKGKYAWMNTYKIINCKPNTNYTVSCNIESVNKGDYNANPFVEVYTNEKIHQNRNVRLDESGSVSFTTNNEAEKLIIYFFANTATYSSTECEANFKDIELYESDVYPIIIAQSYNETDGIILPNGVKNTIENGTVIKRVGKIIVDGTNDLGLVSIRDNTLRLFLTDSTIKNVNESDLPFLCDSLPKTTSCWTYDVEGIYQAKQNHRFVISISKSKLSGSTIEAVKSYFATNPMIIYYELATPITEPLTPTEISLPQPLRSLPNGVCDEVVGNKLIQNIYELKFDSNFDFNNSVIMGFSPLDTSLLRFDITLSITTVIGNVNSLISNIFPYLYIHGLTGGSNTVTQECITNHSANRFAINVIIKRSRLTSLSVDGFKEWCIANDFKILYQLETPIEHTINVPPISISKGTNMVTTNNNIKPELTFKYKQSTKIIKYLYNSGNEYLNITGGYLTSSNNSATCNIEKQVDNLYVNCTGIKNLDSICYARTNKTIKPCKIKVNINANYISSYGIAFCMFLSEKETISTVGEYNSIINKKYITASNTTQNKYIDLEIDLTDNTEGYFYILCMVAGDTGYTCKANIRKIEIIR